MQGQSFSLIIVRCVHPLPERARVDAERPGEGGCVSAGRASRLEMMGRQSPPFPHNKKGGTDIRPLRL
ncbi:hypothetical protein ABTH91_21875, partial [Acinetobacter baumannii]